LRPVDAFNVIEFNSDASSLFPVSVAASDDKLARARSFVAGLSADGGTEMRRALELALGMPPAAASLRQIVFITDGAVGYEEELFTMIESGLNGARLFTVGIGSAPNGWFMRKAAEAGRGTFTFVSDLNEIAEKMDRLFTRLSSPQVTNIEVLWPGGTLVDMYPATVPDLYRGEPVALRAKLAGSPRRGDRVLVTGSAPGGAWSAELELGGRPPAPGVGALWARARIADLLDAGRRGADPDSTRAAIVETALAHHLVSRHTSLVAVDRTPVRSAGDPLSAERMVNRVAHGQAAAAITGLPATATNAATLARAGLLAIAAAFVLLMAPQLPGRIRRGRAD
jgi:Ca-activated chloride channel family protein